MLLKTTMYITYVQLQQAVRPSLTVSHWSLAQIFSTAVKYLTEPPLLICARVGRPLRALCNPS